MVGYIKLYRQMTHWEWYTDINTKTLFLHCLLMVNHKDNEWRGIDIKSGSFVTSFRKLASETGLTLSQIRTSINKLKMTQDIAQESHTSFIIIKVLNYAKYQGLENDDIAQESHKTSLQSSIANSNKQELKELKNYKNIEKDTKKKLQPYFEDEKLNTKFEDYLSMRVSIKKKATPQAIGLAISKLKDIGNDDTQTMIEILEQSIFNSWQGLFELKNKPKIEKEEYHVKTSRI